MSETLPLFPLGTVLFPGLVLPLHIFEDRYRQLVHDLLAGPGPQRFGVVAIREGRETGADGVVALHGIGCVAMVRRITPHGDGRFDLVTAGTQRFRLGDVDHSRPYLRGVVDILTEDTGEQPAAATAARGVREAFGGYLAEMASRGAAQVAIGDLPHEPVALSYLVAASMVVDLPERQALLAAPDALRRLTAERALLSRETAMVRSFTSAPDPQRRYSPYSRN